MPTDSPSPPPHGRRGHGHRGRRGPDRRAIDRRQQTPQPRSGDQVDVEQIMRDIRARIAAKHGIDLSEQQMHELAARRLEAILDVRTVNPTLVDQVRRSAGSARATTPSGTSEPPYQFEDNTIYDSNRGLMRFIRRLLNPLLKLFFNPNPLIKVLNTQARLNVEAARREAERDQRQGEWNALHYEILQRLVTEVSRVSLEGQSLGLRVESLAAKVDFNERRVRGIEGALHQSATTASAAPAVSAPLRTTDDVPAPTPVASEAGAADAPRRRRRRRRGRRGTMQGGVAPGVPQADGALVVPTEGDQVESDALDVEADIETDVEADEDASAFLAPEESFSDVASAPPEEHAVAETPTPGDSSSRESPSPPPDPDRDQQ